jgi:mRNA interferase MazF
VTGFDELIEPSDQDFKASGLKASSLIRLGYLAIAPASEILGVIGSISAERHKRLLEHLSKLLQPKSSP